MMNNPVISDEQVAAFHEQGFLVLRSFYDVAAEIVPVQRAIHHILGLIIQKHALPIRQTAFTPETFDQGYQQIIAHDRRLGGEIYDAVKQIPAFIRLLASEKHEALVTCLRQSLLSGIAAAGYGIRIDNPFEEKYRAPWHQDYPAQLRSLDGIVLWSPLVPITPEMGPVKICVGSHKDGIVRVHTRAPDHPEKTGAYALVLEDEENRVVRYPQVAPNTQPGDLILLDYLVIHASGQNYSMRSRWSMQMRYFNYDHWSGRQLAWRGSFAAGQRLEDIHPELIVDEKEAEKASR